MANLAGPKPVASVAFNLITLTASKDGPRVGRLLFPGRAPMETPNFLAVTSRGAVPHISQDMMRDHTSIKSVYTALEDCKRLPKSLLSSDQKAPQAIPPVYDVPATPSESPLRKFIALQRDALLILGPRRIPPLACPAASTATSIAIVTSLGFRMLECGQYIEAVQRLRPDIVLGMGDVLSRQQPGVKRAERMGDRTQSWLNALIAGMRDPETGVQNTALFAPILPIGAEKQSWYLGALEDDFQDSISGLVLYDNESLAIIPRLMNHLPRLMQTEAKSPHDLLDAIVLGVDVFTVSFLNEATDAGIALDFTFGKPSALHQKTSNPLGLDLWSTTYAVDQSPLRKDCVCYACTNHHRAYVQHLLNAREMLSWVLLQLHNHHVVTEFFSTIRRSIQQETFEQDVSAFNKAYQRNLPDKSGEGPRTRGYQFKSEGKGQPKKNPLAYRLLNDRKAKLEEVVVVLSPKTNAADLEAIGFADIFQEDEGEPSLDAKGDKAKGTTENGLLRCDN